jgi:PKD repeat protein
MKKYSRHIVVLSSFLAFSANIFAQGVKEYFKDKHGFFFFIGIDVPKQNVNLVWDEINSKSVSSYILERSEDGKKFISVITQSAENIPRDVRKMSVGEQESLRTLNTIVYTTETGKGRFVFNEQVPIDLIKNNKILRSVVENTINWEDKMFLQSSLENIFKENQLVYRIKFNYTDGSSEYSGQRAIADYLFFILKRSLDKANDMGLLDKPKAIIWPTISERHLLKSDAKPTTSLVACPTASGPPACVKATGNSRTLDGTCCNYTEAEYLSEQVGGAPCTKSNSGAGICAPLILDCGSNLPSSDPCCAGDGCSHYAVCGCKPWECCVYAKVPEWYVTTTNTLTPPTSNFTYANVCLGKTTTFTSTSSVSGNSGSITTYAWSFGDGSTSASQNPTHTYTASGTYSVTLSITTSNDCNSLITKITTVDPQPIANFSVTTVCLGNTTLFTDQSNGGATQWSWNFGDGNTSTQQSPSHTYTTAGTFTATLTSTGPGLGCNSSISHIVTLYPQPVANFNVTTVCLGNVTQFTDQSTGGATLWSWNLGDGNSSTQQNPINTYTSSGTYTVTMNASAIGGCNSNSTKLVTVYPQPIANFSASSVCFGIPTTFTNLSTGGGTQWSWNFGDGNTSTQQNPSNTYTTSGIYTTSLTATGLGGCNSIIIKQVIIYALPKANFSPADICLNPTSVTFTDLSIGAVQWSWNFGDGTLGSTMQNPSHLFGAPGTYSVSLLVQSIGSCKDSIVQAIHVNPIPDAIFTSNVVCHNNPTKFTDQSLGVPIKWHWEFGDGNFDTTTNPSHTYGTPGTYTVTLIVTNSLGCSDTLPRTALVHPVPKIKFSASTVCIGSPTCFTDMTTISSGVLAAWNWNFDDPASGSTNISNIKNPCHVYSTVGSFNVLLTITSNNNCQSTTSLPVDVTLPPIASFTATSNCLSTPTSFTNGSTGASAWYWTFGDGANSKDQNPSHIYLGYGTYIVSLVASSGGICTDTIRDTITINPLPIVNFKSDSVCIGTPTIFTDASFIPSGNISAWSWDFNDPISGINNTSNLQNPTHIFSSSGTHSVTLNVTAISGCINNKVQTVGVFAEPTADFSFNPNSPIKLTDEITFSDLSSGLPVKWWWDFGDKDTSVLRNPKHRYQDMGTYSVTLVISNQNGCLDTISKPLEIQQFAFYIPNAFTPGTNGINDFFFGKGVGYTTDGVI